MDVDVGDPAGWFSGHAVYTPQFSGICAGLAFAVAGALRGRKQAANTP